MAQAQLVQTVPLPPQISEQRHDWAIIGITAVVFASLSLWGAMTCSGFLEADACTHYLYARFALREHFYLVNVWGRPFCTAIYAIPAALGERLGVRIASMVIALAIAALTMLIARRQKTRWPVLGFVFVLAQPLVFLHSFSELTELPFALLLAVAFVCYQRRWWLAMTCVVAITPTSRPEGFGFLLLAALALIAHRRWWWLAVLPLPLLIWDYAGWRLYGRPMYDDLLLGHALPAAMRWIFWLKHEWPYATESAYTPGSLAHFLMLMPAVTSPLIFPAMCLGIWQSFCPIRRFFSDHLLRCQCLIAIIPLLIFLGHSLLYWRGKMASNGELRYMLIVAPFWALLAARGWEWMCEILRLRHPLRWGAVAALAPILTHFIYPVLPLQYSPDWRQAERIARWYQHDALREKYPFVLTSHPAMLLFLDISISESGKARDWSKQTVATPPPSTILIWDPSYSVYNSDKKRVVPLPEIIDAGWINVADAERNAGIELSMEDVHRPLREQTHSWHIFLTPANSLP
ncbi:MAG TPA: hypothetical protein VIL86_21180 [Tepidisphaeraceae bacterium]|jgi:hypothetical protein